MGKASEMKIESARLALIDTLHAAEIALNDSRAQCGIQLLGVSRSDEYQQRLINRVQMVALALQRIEDAARRFTKRLGIDPSPALKHSQAIRITGALANTWKHGLGGQAQNATMLNGVLCVHRADGFRTEQGHERVHVLGMIIADAEEGSFSSADLFSTAVRDWTAFLMPVLAEADAWAERAAPAATGPVIQYSKMNAVIPLGATVHFAIPDGLGRLLQQEAQRRGASA